MKYKGLFLDLDGTTVPAFTHEPSARVKDAIGKAHGKISVSIATGRPLFMVKGLIDHLDITGLCVVCNGAQIYDPVAKKIVYENLMTHEQARMVFDRLGRHADAFIVFDGEKEFPAKDWDTISKIINYYVQDLRLADIEHLEKEMKDLPGIATSRLLGTVPDKQSLEITTESSTKQFGVFEVAKLQGVETHELIGVGDGYNDFPLLMACGLKIAMGNAVPELKAIADFVAPSVDDDGVAVIIEKFILGE